MAARKLARNVLDERLAACVQIVPQVESLYRWEGEIKTAREWLLLVKTTPSCWPALRDRLAELHPYQVPEILALKVHDGLPAYLDWVGESVCADVRAGRTEAEPSRQGWQQDSKTT